MKIDFLELASRKRLFSRNARVTDNLCSNSYSSSNKTRIVWAELALEKTSQLFVQGVKIIRRVAEVAQEAPIRR